jgi:glycosyltransferase involved in cell wall biosynthesis
MEMGKNDFRASVIITSYNQKGFLVETVESVIRQTVKPYEIIIADDHSTDGSVEVIREYISRHPGWIKGVFQERNVGIPKNRNTALRKVTGNYVSILDGDDRFLPYKIEKENEALQQYPQARCIYGNMSFIDAKGRPMGIRDDEGQPSGDVFVYIARGKFGLLRSMLIDYDLLQEAGFLDVRFPMYDGFDLTVRLAKRCQFLYIPEPLVEYRVYPASASKVLKAKGHLHDLEGIYSKMLSLLSDLPDSDRKEIMAAWSRRIAEFRIREAMEEGEKAKAFLMALVAMSRGFADRNHLGNMAALVTPERMRKLLRWIHPRGRH